MASTFKWAAGWTSRSTVLTTELNALAANALTAVGTEIDNSVNLDQWGQLKLAVDFVSAPTAGDYVNVYMTTAPDGTNYEDPPTATSGIQRLVCSIQLQATTSAQVINGPVFRLEPSKCKFVLENKGAQAFPATGSTLTLFTSNEGAV